MDVMRLLPVSISNVSSLSLDMCIVLLQISVFSKCLCASVWVSFCSLTCWMHIWVSVFVHACLCLCVSSGQSAHHIWFLSVPGKCVSCCHGLPALRCRLCEWPSFKHNFSHIYMLILPLYLYPSLMSWCTLFRFNCHLKMPATHNFLTASAKWINASAHLLFFTGSPCSHC